MQQRQYQVRFGPGFVTPVVRNLLIANGAVFLIQLLLDYTEYGRLFQFYFALTPSMVISRFYVWQVVTYMFLHGGLFHMAMNMLVLMMFGTEIEARMGSSRFLKFYFFCGIGAGVAAFLFPPAWNSMTLGASGAIFGVLLAYGTFFPTRMLLAFFFFPMQARYFVIFIGLLEIYAMLGSPNSGIANFAHLGGLLFGYIFIRFQLWSSVKPASAPRRREASGAPKRRSPDDWKRVDAILDKVNREGMHKLSRQERSFLREMSKRTREEH